MKFLTALGAQAHFVKITKIVKKIVNGVWATARFRKNFERRVDHSNISSFEKKVISVDFCRQILCGSSHDRKKS